MSVDINTFVNNFNKENKFFKYNQMKLKVI